MGKVKSDNNLLALLAGHSARWEHPAQSTNTTYTPRTGQFITLLRVNLNTNGGAVTLRDSAVGVIGTIASDAPEGTFWYGLPLKGNLIVECGAADVTIVYDNR